MEQYRCVFNFLRSVQIGRQDSDLAILFPTSTITTPTIYNVISDRSLLELVTSPFLLDNFTDQRVLNNVTNPNFFLSLMVHNLFLEEEKRTNLVLSYSPCEPFSQNLSDYHIDLMLQHLGTLSPDHSQLVIQTLGDTRLYELTQSPLVRLILADKPLLSFLLNPFLSAYLRTDDFWMSMGDPASLAPEYPPYPQTYAEQLSTRQAMNIVAKTVHGINQSSTFNGFRVNINMGLLLRSIQIENDGPPPPPPLFNLLFQQQQLIAPRQPEITSQAILDSIMFPQFVPFPPFPPFIPEPIVNHLAIKEEVITPDF